MPGRCSCPGSSCGCTIQAGPGIVVTGTGTVDSPFEVAVDTRSVTIDQSSAGALDLSQFRGDAVVNVNLAANVTSIILPDVPGTRIELVLTQTVAGRTVVWPASVKWPGGTQPVLSTVAGRIDWISLRQVTATQWLGRTLGIGMA